MNRDCPRFVIAGAHSGVGKTSVALAVVGALRRRGYRVQTFKVGPDFLDPSYLSLASGRPCYNLDGWMTGREYVLELFFRASEGADISVIEGVMGMFDGADPKTLSGSTAEIALWLDAPVLLVADVHGMARSVAALVKGYAEFEPGVRVSGVLANRCGSPKHVEWLAQSLQSSSLPPLVGGIPLGAFPRLPSRHLGLVTADTQNLSAGVLEQLAVSFEQNASVDKILSLAREASPIPAANPAEPGALIPARIAVARDKAFHFYYQDLLDGLKTEGGELIPFSPIDDARLPDGCQGIYFGGGYPEENAAALAANESMLEGVRRFAASGRPIYAECGGLMYLGRSLRTLDGKEHALAGTLPVSTRMLERRKALGYVEVELREDSLWGRRGESLRGHEFHYSELEEDPVGKEGWRAAYALRRRDVGTLREEGFQRGRVLASYAHLHLASHPQAVRRFLSLCGDKT
ncbi:MAG TPA: cobyrinate a,c-diamide synthase [Thermodesulfobacteriota bacterium]|nr:cobyrinate a,c-diamide synthase [Thermodesulfobacteriota bacterium]